MRWSRSVSAGLAVSTTQAWLSRAAAEVPVEVIDVGTQAVLASGRFRGTGFQFTVPSQRDVALRATRRHVSSGAAAVATLADHRSGFGSGYGTPLGPVHTFTGPTFNSGAGVTRDLQIPSGFNQVGQVVGSRHAAPFAILDTLHQGIQRILQVAPNADFPPLTIDWGPNNEGGVTFYTNRRDRFFGSRLTER